MSRTTRPTLDEARAACRLVGDVRDLRGDPPAQRARMVEGMCNLLGARQGTALVFENFAAGLRMRFVTATHAGWANVAATAMWEQLLHAGQFDQDVVLVGCRRYEAARSADERRRRPATILRPEVVSDDAFYAAPLIRELLPVLEIDGHVVGWHTPAPGAPTLAMTFHRDIRDPKFAPRQREVLRLFFEELALAQAGGKLDAPAAPDARVRNGRPGPALSPRERAVLKNLLAGRSVKETAAALRLSPRTVEDYVKALYRKHDVHSRAELMTLFVNPPQ
ncbi:MAG TPA: LuxR C-terminal-related transcriptional regulator [Tepidisphaeraceae bacterium]|nr:LuxR C-terminal-related transcriptional regulator [Tepidisphaeraceae bacterium]